MLSLQMLPAACGDCLWLEYGEAPNTRVVIIDGGLRATAKGLRARIEEARAAREVERLDVELLVVTHIDNDHIVGIIELLKSSQDVLNVLDIWFNGRPQLAELPALSAASAAPATASSLLAPADLMGDAQGDELSELLKKSGLPWNSHALWKGGAVRIPEKAEAALPSTVLDGDLKLTVLGPSLDRLHKLCTVWKDVLGGDEDEPVEATVDQAADFMGRSDTWPPTWKDGEKSDSSKTNGSSIALLAEYGRHALLLTGDAHASDLEQALDRLARERKTSAPLTLSAFKLAHHGSEKNLTQALMEKISCSRYLISTDGSTHRHPDHQALLRILRYSRRTPELVFNCISATTEPWGVSKKDVEDAGLGSYEVQFPQETAEGAILRFD